MTGHLENEVLDLLLDRAGRPKHKEDGEPHDTDEVMAPMDVWDQFRLRLAFDPAAPIEALADYFEVVHYQPTGEDTVHLELRKGTRRLRVIEDEETN